MSIAASVYRNLRGSFSGGKSLLHRNEHRILGTRLLTLTCAFSQSEKFQEAVKKLSGLKAADNQTKLQLYALYKQATVGKNETKKPGVMDFVGKAKWDAWTSLGNMAKEEAENKYVATVNNLLQAEKGESSVSSKDSTASETTSGSTSQLLITTENGVRTIKLNRPNRKNALTPDIYKEITKVLTDCNEDNSVKIVVLTGSGDYFCSGNDLENFMDVTDPVQSAKDGRHLLQAYVGAYIDLKKPLVALVNGPAIGVAVTVLGLCDAVFCTDKATFRTPFSELGQSPEGCSSYIFPRIMGYAKAGELLYFNQKITAREAENCGLVTQVYPDDRFHAEASRRVNEMSQLPLNSLVFSKELIRGRERELLHEVNAKECERLEERWTSEDCANAIMNFFSKRSKM